ncbi:phage holin family protein [Nesterenkonia halotolerans]|uniref:Membrane protein n=1 Tax=Nesterenkonia halotolerans TaxID=225325 RepID=A0ABR9J6J5_9MICC|nr:phage holin family protein [Nesterenkonia halotolerans]MBE1514599.1 putative membrane protein [Nesterenkonia halotolerans]
MRILLAIILNALALAAAAFLIPGIYVDGAETGTGATILAFLFVGAVFGLVNVVIKPIIALLSLPITCLTLGLFAVVINAGMLMLTAWLTSWVPVHFVVEDFFFSAILGSIVVSLVSALLNRFILRPLEN